MIKKIFVSTLIVLTILVLGISYLAPRLNPSEDAGDPFPEKGKLQIAHLGDNDQAGLENIKATFSARNPGYDLSYIDSILNIEAEEAQRVLFVQEGSGTAELSSGESSKFSVGDIILLAPGETLISDSLLSVLSFTTPDLPPDSLPKVIRPDWDDNITDVVGGCATETGAYRRILLTWMGKVGPYLYHSINAHRVRIMDSFTHYHPVDGGFDEFYLVQMAIPGAAIITSEYVDLIEDSDDLSKEQAGELMQRTPLKVGDLVYLPRGLAHRGVDGVLAQVITVPGFIPKSEIGIDHHLKAINEKLGLDGEEALPFNQEASNTAIVK